MYDACYDLEVDRYIEEAGLRKIDARREAAEFAASIKNENGIELHPCRDAYGEFDRIEIRNLKTDVSESWRLVIDDCDRRVWFDDFSTPLSTDDLRKHIAAI